MFKPGAISDKGYSTKARSVQPGVRQGESRFVAGQFAIQQQVEIQGARPARYIALASLRMLDVEQGLHERNRAGMLVSASAYRINKIRLIGDAHRRGAVQR